MHWLDPDYLPATKGKVKQFLLNPHGDADGLILEDGMEVHFPPHMGADVLNAVSPGDKVTIRGAKPRGADLIAAVAIDTASGGRIDDNGPPDDDPKHGAAKGKLRPMAHDGAVSRALHGPKGETRGALLEDGVIVRFPKHAAEPFAELIVPGARLAVRGHGVKTDAGTVIEAEEMGVSPDSLRSVHKAAKGKKKHGEALPGTA
jgi:hypothetical protein